MFHVFSRRRLQHGVPDTEEGPSPLSFDDSPYTAIFERSAMTAYTVYWSASPCRTRDGIQLPITRRPDWS